MSNHFVQFGKKWERVGGIFFGVGERATRSLQRCVKYVHVFLVTVNVLEKKCVQKFCIVYAKLNDLT